MRISNEWKNYECLDAGNGEKLERWGNVLLRRPEPLAMWPIEMDDAWKRLMVFIIDLLMVEVIGNLIKSYLIIGQWNIKI